jgi:regulator of ribonuclease activity A
MPERLSTSDAVDQHGEAAAVCETRFVQYGGRREFAGPISTVRCHEDNVMLRRRVGEPGAGGVLVVDGGGSLRVALLGDILAGLARDSGWAGVVINGCVRDVAALAAFDVGIKALAACPRPSAKLGAGEIDVDVTFGGVTFAPGATLVSDDDGIVVLAAQASTSA